MASAMGSVCFYQLTVSARPGTELRTTRTRRNLRVTAAFSGAQVLPRAAQRVARGASAPSKHRGRLLHGSMHSFSRVAAADSRFDVEVVAESDAAAVVWKRPGVSVERQGQNRRAGEALISCVTHLWGQEADVTTDLETWAGGLILVSKDSSAASALKDANHEITSVFEAVVLGLQNESSGGSEQDVKLARQALVGSTSASEACDALATEKGTPVAGRTGSPALEGVKGAHVALVQVCGLPEELGLGSSVEHPTPKKFLKLMKRTALRASRREELQAASASSGPGGASETSAEFFGSSFVSAAPMLLPRKSSEAVVQVALDFIAGQEGARAGGEAPRVLDLGTGCGCLLLSVLRHCPGTASGVGVELNSQALGLAERNIQAMVSEGFLEEGQATLVKADFGKLHTKSIREHLIGDGNGPFDVIISNPPFLASNRAIGRVTAEDEMVLVGGETGMEAYEAICKSLARCSPSLLKPGGILLLQAPGGDRGHIRVSAVVRQCGFEVKGTVKDERGVQRTVVCAPKGQSLNGSGSPGTA